MCWGHRKKYLLPWVRGQGARKKQPTSLRTCIAAHTLRKMVMPNEWAKEIVESKGLTHDSTFTVYCFDKKENCPAVLIENSMNSFVFHRCK